MPERKDGAAQAAPFYSRRPRPTIVERRPSASVLIGDERRHAMADPRRRPPTDEGVPPAAAEGTDPYPTYRDGPVPPHPTTASKPTDVGLPQSQRTRASPMLIGLIVFALVVLAYLVWGGLQMTEST